MSAVPPDSRGFALAECPACRKEVLTHPDWIEGEEVRLCVHCDVEVRPPLRWVEIEELAERGYATESGGGGCASCSASPTPTEGKEGRWGTG